MSVANALHGIPDGLRVELLGVYTALLRNFREGNWEGCVLGGGKVCEIVFSIVKGKVDGTFPDRARKPANMVAACQELERSGGNVGRGLRIQIPRVILAVYEIRNNRGGGHVGGEVDSNHMDATLVVAATKWMLAELVRALHALTPVQARQVVDAIVDRELPMIWEVDGRKRVLAAHLSAEEKALLLLYTSNAPMLREVLRTWTGYANQSRFGSDILQPLHARALIHLSSDNLVHLSPIGTTYVEGKVLPRASDPRFSPIT